MASNGIKYRESEWSNEFPALRCFIAVRMDHTILVLGGMADETVNHYTDLFTLDHQLRHSIFLFNIYIEKWRKHGISKLKEAPQCLDKACGVSIGEDIYTFGGGFSETNQLWKLTRIHMAALTGKTYLSSKKTRILPQDMGNVAGNTEVNYIYLVVMDHHQMST